ncbi:uncharacterized protein ACA1_369530 [Acanthamoeba castellanii str. Neff]|uniref:Uncharacterized protein n=1 Tax=Acanthamoeba castellanii (strain ATCC 30010 / Neff) TaxID=1257118 RepID=L8GZ00_ACACF|nr:uncharacterized protein ACA1_369530 [Acanthamoeba castellanii str. Neff]ELR18210.1 hypothetical protein ACA1_369530 [Acanthamoeba castellanii str. Neff]
MEQPQPPPQPATTYPGYFYDIKRLVAKYMRSGSPFSYKDFKMLWKEMRFSYIHHAKPMDMEYGEYMQRLYSSTLGFLYSPQPLLVLVGTLYTLYTLYNTQLKKPRTPIRISKDTWQYLHRLYLEIKNQRIWEAYHVFRKLRQDQSFCFTAYAPVGPRSTPTTNLHMLTELPPHLQQADTLRNVLDVSAIDKIARLNAPKAPLKHKKLSTQDELNVADAHLGSDLKAMLSEIERAYQTSDRGSAATAAAFAFRPPATAHSRPTPAPPPPALAAPPPLLAVNGRPDAAREAAKRKAHFEQKFATQESANKRPRIEPTNVGTEAGFLRLQLTHDQADDASSDDEELRRSAQAMEELLNGHDAFSNLRDDNEENA